MDTSILEQTNDATTAPAPLPKEYDGNGHLLVKLSERATATLSELTGLESMQADEMLGASQSSLRMLKLYALFALRSLTINGQPFPLPAAKNDMNINQRAQTFTASELSVLCNAYCAEFMLPPLSGDALKN